MAFAESLTDATRAAAVSKLGSNTLGFGDWDDGALDGERLLEGIVFKGDDMRLSIGLPLALDVYMLASRVTEAALLN